MPMFHYVSGVYCYLYFDQMHVNLIWYLWYFMLNKICLSLSELRNVNSSDKTAICFPTNLFGVTIDNSCN